MVTLALIASAGVWFIVFKATARHRFGVPALFLYLVGFRLFIRPLLLLLGLTDVKSGHLFSGDLAPLTVNALLFSILWLTAIGVAYFAFGSPARGVARFIPRVSGEPNRRAWATCLLILTVPGAIAAGTALSQGGGLAGSVRLVRREGFFEQSGIEFIRKAPQVALALSCAAIAYELWRRRQGSRQAAQSRHSVSTLLAVGVVTGIINLLANLTFGDKSSLLLPALLFWYISRLMFKRRSIVRGAAVLLSAVLVLGVFGSVRSSWNAGESWQGLPSSTRFADEFVDAFNLEGFDRLMLLMQDWNEPSTWLWGTSFRRGIEGIVPRFLWEGKPDQITTGGEFRNGYTGEDGGGWPLITWGQWYINFGPLGVVASGLLAGWLLRAMSERYRGFQHDPLAAAFMVVMVFVLFPHGITPNTPKVVILWLVPLHFIAGQRLRRRGRTELPHLADAANPMNRVLGSQPQTFRVAQAAGKDRVLGSGVRATSPPPLSAR